MPAYEVLTDDELAAEWKVPKRAIQKLLRDGRLLGFHVGDRWRVTRAAVIEYTDRKAS